ncbi:DNA-packaging protein gp3 [Cohaesibacter sp. ES.047]|uniref:terminase small subunit n=1 Tax=Cohaesibacter sp. ES.047 TaxID=1798205 RepID=UPI000BB82B35|nr:terminase small subunit [Cohaesibacter sp. ES.047]SNY93961.1 DNA-packaging protein gp3 [Cohaesibacter sp. ES.047]
MVAPKGNRYWAKRRRNGRKPLYETPDQLWRACVKYFEWVEATPLKQEEIIKYRDRYERIELNKMRAMSKKGLCVFLDIDPKTWEGYKTRGEDFFRIITRVEDIIWDQKFTGAAAGILNGNIIARELPLGDKEAEEPEAPAALHPGHGQGHHRTHGQHKG